MISGRGVRNRSGCVPDVLIGWIDFIDFRLLLFIIGLDGFSWGFRLGFLLSFFEFLFVEVFRENAEMRSELFNLSVVRRSDQQNLLLETSAVFVATVRHCSLLHRKDVFDERFCLLDEKECFFDAQFRYACRFAVLRDER